MMRGPVPEHAQAELDLVAHACQVGYQHLVALGERAPHGIRVGQDCPEAYREHRAHLPQPLHDRLVPQHVLRPRAELARIEGRCRGGQRAPAHGRQPGLAKADQTGRQTHLPRQDGVDVASARHRSARVPARPQLLGALDRGEHDPEPEVDQVDIRH